MSPLALWVQWSWRDLRARWPQVFALALVIALGTGTYAALMSTSAWRTRSNDASFALLNVHDLRVALAPGSTVPEGSLLGLVRWLPHAAEVAGARERLIVPTQVAGPKGVLAPGELVGTGPGTGPAVDGVHVTAGRGLATAGGASAGGGLPTVALDRAFAQQNDLPATGLLHVAGAGWSATPGSASHRSTSWAGAGAPRCS
jgi:putative ABC transport system permease protein